MPFKINEIITSNISSNKEICISKDVIRIFPKKKISTNFSPYLMLRQSLKILDLYRLCSGIIVDLNVFSTTVNKPTLIIIEPSSFKTCVYLVLITLFISDDTRSLLPPSCATPEKVTIAHTFRVREISPLLDQYGSSFVVTLLILKPKYEPLRCSVTYYHCILLSNVLDIRTPR